jgi:hypothetical protein
MCAAEASNGFKLSTKEGEEMQLENGELQTVESLLQSK